MTLGTSIGQDLLNVPMGEMIRQMAMSIAEAQFELDKSSIMVAEMMGGQRLLRDNDGNLIDYEGDVLEPTRDANGNPIYDREGNLVYASGKGPRVIDSRVHFGYQYEEGEDAAGDPVMHRKPKLVSMMELGFTPTFYQFVDTIIEVKIAIKIQQETSWGISVKKTTETRTTKDIIEPVKTFGWSYQSGTGASYSGAAYKHKKTGTQTKAVVSSVDAHYSNKYSYSAEGSSLLRTKLVPVPSPAILEERIREVMEAEREYLRRVAGGDAPAVDEPAPKVHTTITP